MREILFRGKHKAEWVYGSLLIDERGNTYIGTYLKPREWQQNVVSCGRASGKTASRFLGIGLVLVDSATVGQFTGLTDKTGKKIFEGDIVCDECFSFYQKDGVVTFGTGTFDSGIYRYTGWHLVDRDGNVDRNELAKYDTNEFVVIGNIYDNSELLGKR